VKGKLHQILMQVSARLVQTFGKKIAELCSAQETYKKILAQESMLDLQISCTSQLVIWYKFPVQVS